MCCRIFELCRLFGGAVEDDNACDEKNDISQPGSKHGGKSSGLPQGLPDFDGAEIKETEKETQRNTNGATRADSARCQRSAEKNDDEVRKGESDFQVQIHEPAVRVPSIPPHLSDEFLQLFV